MTLQWYHRWCTVLRYAKCGQNITKTLMLWEFWIPTIWNYFGTISSDLWPDCHNSLYKCALMVAIAADILVKHFRWSNLLYTFWGGLHACIMIIIILLSVKSCINIYKVFNDIIFRTFIITLFCSRIFWKYHWSSCTLYTSIFPLICFALVWENADIKSEIKWTQYNGGCWSTRPVQGHVYYSSFDKRE